MDTVEITEERINVDRVTSLVTHPSCGAVSVFIGTTRDNFDGKKVKQLEYECYDPMAKKEMKKICDQIRAKWSVVNIAMVHRLGVVPVTEASVVVAVASPHRRECLQAVEYAIDTLKATVPIWKKEIYEDDSSEWKSNKECCGRHKLNCS